MKVNITLSCDKKYVNINDIKVPSHIKNDTPELGKILMYHQDYIYNGYLDPIIIDGSNVLVDGYISYLINAGYGHENVRVYQIKASI